MNEAIAGTDNRVYEVENGIVTEMYRVDPAHDEAEAAAECYAEFGSSWVAGGGRAEDVAAAWRQGIAYANGYAGAPTGF